LPSLVGPSLRDFLFSRFPRRAFDAPNRVRAKSNFAFPFKLIWVVQSFAQKFLTFGFAEISEYSLCPGPKEGRIANVTYVGPVMRWT